MSSYISSRRIKYQWISWLLIVITLVNLVNPVGLIFAGEKNSGSWEVSYSLALEDDTGIAVGNNDGDIVIAAKEGEEVFLTMQLIADDEENYQRFKDTFQLKMPEDIYQALVDENGEADEWFESDMTNSEYLLELTESVATGSNARRSVRASGSNASPSDAADETVELNFRFVEELRKTAVPEAVEFEDSEFKVSFLAPEDMVLILSPDGYNCEIMAVTNMAIMPLAATGCWDVTSSFMVSRNDAPVETNPGSPIYIAPGDKIKFGFMATIKKDIAVLEERYDETFKVKMPKILYDKIKDKIVWPTTNLTYSGYIFDQNITLTDDKAGNYVLEFRFNDFSGAEEWLTDAGLDFEFEATEKVIMNYQKNNEDDSISIEYRPVSDTSFSKKLVGVISEDEFRYGETASIKNGDYAIFNIRVQMEAPVAGQSYTFEKGTVYDFFYDEAYDYMDITSANPTLLADLKSWIQNSTGATESQKSSMIKTLEVDNDRKSWYELTPAELDALPPAVSAYKDSHKFYGNLKPFTIDKKDAADQTTSIDLYICMKLKSNFDVDGTYEAGGKQKPNSDKVQNSLFLTKHSNDDIKGAKPGTGFFYDVALLITGTSIWHSGSRHVSKIGSEYKFPSIEKNAKAKVKKDDYVTYRITTSSQGTSAAFMKKVCVYLPRGLELVTDASELAALGNFKYTTGPDIWEDSSSNWGTEASANHVYPVPDGTGLHQFTDPDWSGYSDIYAVERYDINYDTPSRGDIFITCRVRDIKDVMQEVGLSADDPDDLAMAGRYAYLLTAEVTEAVDAKDHNISITESSTNEKYRDTDSLLDNSPFNDWYNLTTGKLKNPGLYYYSGTSPGGEADEDTGNHVRRGAYTWDKVNGDEDDFDFALVYPYEAVAQESSVTKAVYSLTTDEQKEINNILTDINTEGNTNYILLTNGTISRTQTVIPYVITINKDGSKKMDDVVFEDTLPGSMSFLTYSDGTPIVKIKERIERNGHRYEAEGVEWGIIDPTYSDLVTVKEYASEVYVPGTGSEMPGTVAANEIPEGSGAYYWKSGVDLPDKKVLTIDFGNINNNSFEIVYFAIVDKVSNAYENNAVIYWGENVVEEVSTVFSNWESSATGRAYSKYVSLEPDGNFDETEVLIDEVDHKNGFTVYYKLGAEVSTINKHYAANELFFSDTIRSVIVDGKVIPGDISILKVVETIDKNPSTEFLQQGTATSPLGGDYFEVSTDKNVVQITNKTDFTNMIVHVSAYIAVHYSDIAYGSQVSNYFQSTTLVKSPLRLDLTKVDGNNESKGLADAKFALYYEGGTAVKKSGKDGEPVTLKTIADGTASAEFHLDPDKKDTENNGYYLYLKEETPPKDYFGLGGKDAEPVAPYVIKLKAIQDANGTYSFMAIDEDCEYSVLTTGTLNQIQIKAMNYQSVFNQAEAELELELTKKLLHASGGNEMPLDQQYEFTIALASSSNAGAVEIQGATTVKSELGSGRIFFDRIVIREAGTYQFLITEEHPLTYPSGHNAMSYDPGTITATVRIAEGDEKLIVESITYEKSEPLGNEIYFDEDGTKRDETFVNFYIPDSSEQPTGAKLEAVKELVGRTLKDQEFTFKAELVYASNGYEMPDMTATNDSTGKVVFEELYFDGAGVYVYEISEDVTGGDDSVTYDTTKYYVSITVETNRIGDLEVTGIRYGDSYNTGTHEVSGSITKPSFKNVAAGNLIIKKISQSNGTALTGAKFELAYRETGSGDEAWVILNNNLVTAGADGSISHTLPENYQQYEYRLTETQAPSGYSKSRVGTITFTVSANGRIAEWNHTGTGGYVDVNSDKTAFIVKNHTTGGNPGNPGNPSTPGTPGIPGTPGGPGSSSGDPVTTIEEASTPLSQLVDFIEEAVPLAGLVKTGDYGIPVLLLVLVMMMAAAGIGVVMHRRKKESE